MPSSTAEGSSPRHRRRASWPSEVGPSKVMSASSTRAAPHDTRTSPWPPSRTTNACSTFGVVTAAASCSRSGGDGDAAAAAAARSSSAYVASACARGA